MTQLVTLGRGPTHARTRPATARVLLISPSYARERNTMYFPIGLSYLSAYIRQFGYSVLALNMNHAAPEDRYRELGRLLDEEPIDVVGISGLTVAFNEVERIVAFVRERSRARVVLGGGITSCESELVMRVTRPDFMVVGEGELIFHELLQAIEHGGDVGQVRGIWHWTGDEPRFTGEGASIGKLDDLPEPDLERFGMQQYLELQSDQRFGYHETRLEGARHVPITASRSCPFRCTFCYHAGMGKYRRHSIPAVVDHIKACIERFGVRYFQIYDELFSANQKRVLEFCELVKDLNVTWFCQLRVDQLSQSLLDAMSEAGCIKISYGFESGSDAVLESMQKKISARQIAEAVDMTRKARIGIQANFLFGDPAETEQTVRQTLEFQRDHELEFVDWSAVIPYPGTALYARALERGLIDDRESYLRRMGNVSEYLWKHMLNLSQIPDERFRELYVELREHNDENHRRRRSIVASADACSATSSRLVLQCPSCQHREPETEIPYPPECQGGGAPHLRTAVGVPGLNVTCSRCQRKHHLAAREIPHVGRVYSGFQRALDRLVDEQAKVVVLPAMDRYYGVFSRDVDLSGLNVSAAFDLRPANVGTRFLGQQVRELTPENLAAERDATAVVLPWAQFEEALAVLERAGFDSARVLCWNQTFAEALRADPARGPRREQPTRTGLARRRRQGAAAVRRA